PRPVSFLAKSPLFRTPVVSFFVRALDSIPVYRKQDEGADTSRNRETFERAARLLRRGGTIAICPEGASHSEPYLLPLKTGAARIALGAASVKAQDGETGRRGDGETGRQREELTGRETPHPSHVSPSPRPPISPSSLSIVPVG